MGLSASAELLVVNVVGRSSEDWKAYGGWLICLFLFQIQYRFMLCRCYAQPCGMFHYIHCCMCLFCDPCGQRGWKI